DSATGKSLGSHWGEGWAITKPAFGGQFLEAGETLQSRSGSQITYSAAEQRRALLDMTNPHKPSGRARWNNNIWGMTQGTRFWENGTDLSTVTSSISFTTYPYVYRYRKP